MFFYRCPDCQKFTPKWNKVGESLNNTVKVADFDCALFSKVCKSFHIKNYPTFAWFDDGDIIESIPKECSCKSLVNYALKKSTMRRKREISEVASVNNITEIYESEVQPWKDRESGRKEIREKIDA